VDALCRTGSCFNKSWKILQEIWAAVILERVKRVAGIDHFVDELIAEMPDRE
jgi:hypothetical protein